MRQGLRADLDKFGVVRQIFRQGYLRHRSLMMEALLNPLKRSHQIEKRLVVLARDDAPVGKAAAVHIGLDTKIDLMILISSTQAICMQRVDKPLGSACPLCGGKCLRTPLPPADPADSTEERRGGQDDDSKFDKRW